MDKDILQQTVDTEDRYLREELVSFVLENVDKCRMFNGNIDWAQMVYLAEQEFGDEFTKEKLRGIYRTHTDETFVRQAVESSARSKERKVGKVTLRDQILKRIKNKCALDYLFDTISHPDDEILAEITRLEFEGYMIDKWSEDGKTFLALSKDKHKSNDKVADIKVDKTISIAVVGDTHFGHDQSRIKEFQAFINYAYNKGVRNVAHVGDLTEGSYISIRPTSIRELNAIGFDEQVDLANASMPKLDGLKYYVISGNHDATFDRNAYANPVKMLSRMRDDVHYLGHNLGRIKLNDLNDIVLVHPDDGIGQNYSLKLHQHIDRAEENKLGRIVLMGHYHKHAHIHYKGIDAFVTPAFVGQSNFMRDRNLRAVVGGIILHLGMNEAGEIFSVTPEYIWFD